jgi:hypothetical protein
MRFTATPASRLWASNPAAQGLVEHRETIDIIGDVKLWLRDLEEAWKKENERTRVEVTRPTPM